MTTRVRLASSHENATTSPDSGSSRPAASSATAAGSSVSARTTVTSRAGSVRSAHTPCSTRSRRRRTGCAATTAWAARSTSAGPVPSGACSVLAWANRARDPPSSRWRRMIGVGVRGPSSRRAGAGAACCGLLAPRCSASARGVLSRNTSRGAIGRPSALARLITVMATMLSPPARKKSVSASTAASDSVSAKMPTTAPSTESLTPSLTTAGVSSRAARSVRAFRSSLPLTVSGRASIASTRPGTMWTGSFADSRFVRSPGTRPTTCATRWPASAATVTATSTTPSSSLTADSTSPNSIRNPLSWT